LEIKLFNYKVSNTETTNRYRITLNITRPEPPKTFKRRHRDYF
jgi:hypothetical protein